MKKNHENFFLQSSRLRLHPFNKNDTELFLTINREESVREFLWDGMEISPDQAKQIVIKSLQHFRDDGFGLWKIFPKLQSEVIGYSGLWYFFDEPQPQLIYILLPEYRRNGYAAEAAIRIMDYAFNDLGFSYLIAAMDEGHTASEKVAQRIGMKFRDCRVIDSKSTLFYQALKQ